MEGWRKVAVGRERRKLREMNEVPEKFLGHTHWLVYACEQADVKGSRLDYKGTNENRASRKTARYGSLKCSHSAHAKLINDRRGGKVE